MAMRIVEVEKLAHSEPGLLSGYKASLPLQERGWTKYPLACWDRRALLAFHDDICIAGLNFSEDEDELIINIDFAWSDPRHPSALACLLARFRSKYSGSKFREIKFTCHEGNEPMARAVGLFGLRAHTHTYRMSIEALRRAPFEPLQRSTLERAS